MVAMQTDDLHPDRRGGRATRRSFLFKAMGMGGASFALMLAQACQSQGGAPPSYGGSAPASTAPTQAPAAAAPPTQAPAAKPADAKPATRAAAGATPQGAQPTAAAQRGRPAEARRHAHQRGHRRAADARPAPRLPGHLDLADVRYLVYFDKDNKVQPNLAESWDVQDDGAAFVFKLRKGVKFHNGREVVADDVKYSIERLQDKPSVFAGDYAAIQKIDVIDPCTVKFSFAKPFPGIFRMLAQFKGGEIVAKEAVEQNGDLARTGMGTGPFMFDHWTPGNEIVLKKNPQLLTKPGLPYLDGITFKIIPDEAGIVAGLRTGAVQHMQILDFTNVPGLQNEPNVTVYRIPRVQDGVVAMYVNARIGPLADPKVREALYWAFDREAAVKIATAGQGIATGPISPTVDAVDAARRRRQAVVEARLDKAKVGGCGGEGGSGKYADGIKTEVWADATTRWRVDTAQILSPTPRRSGSSARW